MGQPFMGSHKVEKAAFPFKGGESEAGKRELLFKKEVWNQIVMGYQGPIKCVGGMLDSS